MAPEKDYTHRSWIAVTLLIAVLIGLSLIPPQTLGGVSLRRANILSDLISFEEDLEKAEKAIDLDDADFHIDLTQVARQIADTVPQHAPTTYEWNLREEADDTTAQPRLPDSVRLSPTLIPIEDFDTTGHSRLTAFYEKLQKGDAPVRIAVMGDSFVEGDILSSDLREKLQLRFGGSGAGARSKPSPKVGTPTTSCNGETPPPLSATIITSRAGSANLRTEPPFAGKVHRTGLAWTVAARPGSCSSAVTTAVSR